MLFLRLDLPDSHQVEASLRRDQFGNSCCSSPHEPFCSTSMTASSASQSFKSVRHFFAWANLADQPAIVAGTLEWCKTTPYKL